MKKIAELFVKNTVFANILLVIILMAGILGGVSMTREELPNLDFDTVVVTTSWPGADPEDIEEGISRKIEEAIEGVEGIDSYTATSSEGMCTIVIDVLNGYSDKDVLDDVESNINEINTFPEDAEDPVVKLPQKRFAVLTLGLRSEGDEKSIKVWAESIKDEILRLPEVSQAETSGMREYEISVEVSESKLRKYGLTLDDISAVIKNSSLNLTAGTIRTDKEQLRVRTLGKKYTDKELADITVIAGKDGEIITLGELAEIRDGFSEDGLRVEVNGVSSALVNIYKTEKEDAITISDAVRNYLEEKNQTLPPGSEIKVLADNTDSIRSNINLLLKNGLMGLMLVFLMLWLFLDTRLAFWAGMGIPISMAGGVAVLWATGETINIISLFGLIMVLGIVADDAIVVGEAIFVQRKKGASRFKAAVNGVSEVGLPVLAAILTTVAAFIPLMHIGGVLGKVIACLPVAVIACLLISLLECLIMLPAHLSDLPDPNKEKKPTNYVLRHINAFHEKSVNSMEVVAERYYYPFIQKALRYRYMIFSIAIAVFFITMGLISGGFVKYELFPDKDGFVVNAQLEFPDGTPYAVTEEAVMKIQDGINRLAEKTETESGDPLVVNVISYVGMMPDDDIGESGETGDNFGGVQVVLLDPVKRGIHAKDLAIMWQAEVGHVSGVKKLSFAAQEKGPPGAPVQVCLDGENLETLNAASDKVMERLAGIDGVYFTESDTAPGKNEIRFRLKPQARSLGLTVNDLAKQLYDSYYGSQPKTIQRGDDEIDVYVRYTEDERKQYSSIHDFRVRTADGKEVPLSAVAEISYGPSYSKIVRSNGYKRITVGAYVDTAKIVPGEVVSELKNGFFEELKEEYPDIEIVLEGDAAKDAEAFGSLKVWLPVAVMMIYMIVATMFGSYLQPVIIMFTIPFGLIGAVVGHFFMGEAMSLFSVFGMVALIGVVVNDAIVLIDRINGNLKSGMGFMEAVCKGGARRFRAVMLTSITTIGGLLPVIVETDPNAGMLIPMAISLAAGILFATVLTLVLIPGLLVILNDLRRIGAWVTGGKWKSREAVEPAWTGDSEGPQEDSGTPVQGPAVYGVN